MSVETTRVDVYGRVKDDWLSSFDQVLLMLEVLVLEAQHR